MCGFLHSFSWKDSSSKSLVPSRMFLDNKCLDDFPDNDITNDLNSFQQELNTCSMSKRSKLP